MSMDLKPLPESWGYEFQNPELLTRAFTHKSYANENGGSHNEVLEFLGDSVLDLALSHLLLNQFPEDEEGSLSKKRASLVNENSLASLALANSLDRHLLVGRGEKTSGIDRRPRVLASSLEALIGALYLDGGYEAAQKVVAKIFDSKLKSIDGGLDFEQDHKSRLQEICQKKSNLVPQYRVKSETGPEHQKIFEVEVSLQEKILGLGVGSNKKRAEQQAAKEALEIVEKDL